MKSNKIKVLGVGGQGAVFDLRDGTVLKLIPSSDLSLEELLLKRNQDKNSRDNRGIVLPREIWKITPQEMKTIFEPALAMKKDEELLRKWARSTPSQFYGIVYDKADGDLDSVSPTQMNKLPFETRIHWIRDIVQGLAYLHSKGIIHRDLKGGNILLFGNNAKITDFGFAQFLRPAQTGPGGTPIYFPPEYLCATDNVDSSQSTDYYELGWVLLQILFPKSFIELEDVFADNDQPNNHITFDKIKSKLGSIPDQKWLDKYCPQSRLTRNISSSSSQSRNKIYLEDFFNKMRSENPNPNSQYIIDMIQDLMDYDQAIRFQGFKALERYLDNHQRDNFLVLSSLTIPDIFYVLKQEVFDANNENNNSTKTRELATQSQLLDSAFDLAMKVLESSPKLPFQQVARTALRMTLSKSDLVRLIKNSGLAQQLFNGKSTNSISNLESILPSQFVKSSPLL